VKDGVVESMAGGAALFIDCVDEKAVPVEWNQLMIV
jgi:hypothetical protein